MPSITVRQINFQFSAATQRYWLGGNPFKTHLLNSFTLLFPATEKWSIRVLKKSLRQISNSEVKQDALKFIGQEGQHANSHALFWNNLKQQGYSLNWYFQTVDSALKWFETRFSNAFNVAILAGFEHLTEFIADFGLSHHVLDRAEPELKLLFEWHAAEEIEHKTVAYDVLSSLTRSYSFRILGLIVAHIYAISFLALGIGMLLHYDKKLLNFSVWSDFTQFFLIKEKFFFKACVNFVSYFRGNFHPSQKDSTAHHPIIERLACSVD